ncbi:MAG TPA: hypothetical protein VIM31_04185 [Candidatus Microsaccharimonas sp.]|jgi:hypothetical protein
MSAETPSPQEKSIVSLLTTDKWYPVMSPLSVHGKQESTFWVSEKPEEFMTPLDQSEAQCYRVDFTPENHSTDGASTIGKVATLDPETRIQLLIVGGYAYLGNRDVMMAKHEKEKIQERERRQQEMFGDF